MANKINGHRSILGKMLKHRRLEAELTQYELSEKSGLPVSLISRIERGDSQPTISELRKLAKLLHIKEGELLIYVSAIPEQRFAGKKGQNRQQLDHTSLPRSTITQRLITMQNQKQRNGFIVGPFLKYQKTSNGYMKMLGHLWIYISKQFLLVD